MTFEMISAQVIKALHLSTTIATAIFNVFGHQIVVALSVLVVRVAVVINET